MQKPLILVVQPAQTQPARQKGWVGESKLVGTGKDVNNSGGKDIIRQEGRL